MGVSATDGAAQIGSADQVSPSRLTRWSIGLLSLAACGVAGYLFSLSLANHDLPPGCGHGSGCDEVLNSRWSQVFGVPVSGPAMAVYAAIAATVPFLRPVNSPSRRQWAWSVLVTLAAVVALSAVWFVGLQLAVMRAICPWCLAEHFLGLSIAALVLFHVPLARRDSAADSMVAESTVPLSGLLRAVAAGAVLVAVFAGAQTIMDYHPSPVQRLPAGQNADTGPGPDRLISVLSGQLTLSPHGLPTLGSADAPKLLVVMFDYCCPHCRATHGYLVHGLAEHRDELAVILLPTPLNTKCNPYWERTEPRFEHACELARLALAVWKVDRQAFVRFDDWLFQPEMPRDPEEARREAERLVNPAALREALDDSGIARQIERNVAAYHNSQAERVPVIVSPGMRAIVGRPESEEQLFALLEKEHILEPHRTGKSQ